MHQTNLNDIPPRRALMTLRIIWFALLVGPFVFLAVLAIAVIPNRGPINPQPLFFWVDLGMLLTVAPVTYLIRHLIFQGASVEGGIPAASFSTGNLVFWAGCEGIAFCGLVFAMMNGSLWPTIVIVAIALALQVITFPLAGRVYDPMKTE